MEGVQDGGEGGATLFQVRSSQCQYVSSQKFHLDKISLGNGEIKSDSRTKSPKKSQLNSFFCWMDTFNFNHAESIAQNAYECTFCQTSKKEIYCLICFSAITFFLEKGHKS